MSIEALRDELHVAGLSEDGAKKRFSVLLDSDIARVAARTMRHLGCEKVERKDPSVYGIINKKR